MKKSFTKVGDLKWISVWCKSYSQNFGTLYIPNFYEDNVIPDSDKKNENVISDSDSDKKNDNVIPDSNSDDKKNGNVIPDSDKNKGNVIPDSGSTSSMNAEPDYDDHIIIESEPENNQASSNSVMKFTVISTLIAVFFSFGL